jgi:hypothetical protein
MYKGKRYIVTVLLCAVSVGLRALTIPAGTLYFDNSKTSYASVSLVYGSDQRQESYVLRMTQDGNKWRVTIPQTVTNMYRFTFVGAALRDGLHTQTFTSLKDSISLQAGLLRTATSDAQMSNGDIFVPQSGDNWAQGYWMSLAAWQAGQGSQPGTAQMSGTLPVVYIRTQNSQAVSDKETQVPMTIYIDSMQTKYHSLGSASAPISGTIKGRGNYTWKDFDKKPYKIKFDEKHKVLGMPNNRHWCLMAGADDNLGFLRNPTGYMVSKALALRWTPRMRPVELVLNGQYMGLYFLTEHVRIASHRVKIHEQAEQETHRDSITGGWLVEIDNYWSENNISFNEGNGQYVMVSLKEPETLSQQQRSYLEQQLSAINSALYENTSTHLKQLLDIEEAAKYYLVQEILEDCESYHGSCFLYKDRDSLGIADKWKFGPVWDFGNAYNRHQETWIYINPIWPQYWIGQLAQWPEFQQAVREQWWIYYHTQHDSVRAQIGELAVQIMQAAKNDAARWNNTQGYNDNSDMQAKLSSFLWAYDWRIQWLYSQWGEGSRPATWDVEQVSDAPQGRKLLYRGQVLIQRHGHYYDLMGRPVHIDD